MTETLTPHQIVQLLAEKIPLRDAAVRIIEEMETAFQAEAAEAYTREKRLKEQVEALKQQLRTLVAESGEKLDGVMLAHTQQVTWNAEQEADVVTWCAKYAPTLLTLKGVADIRKWFFAAPIQSVNINGKPSAVLIVSEVGDDGLEHQQVVPCPFILKDDVQVRISESGIITAVNQQQWESEHE